MKIYSLTVLLLSIIILNSNSQDLGRSKLQNEIYGGYGFGSAQEISSVYSDVITPIITIGTLYTETMSPVGPVSLGYRRSFSKNFTLAIAGNYVAFNKQFKKSSDNSVVGTVKNTFYSFIARGDYYYVTGEYFQMYSGVGVGFTYAHDNYLDSSNASGQGKMYSAFQVNAVGIRVGKNFGVFAELGYGFEGIINAGISLKF